MVLHHSAFANVDKEEIRQVFGAKRKALDYHDALKAIAERSKSSIAEGKGNIVKFKDGIAYIQIKFGTAVAYGLSIQAKSLEESKKLANDYFDLLANDQIDEKHKDDIKSVINQLREKLEAARKARKEKKAS